MSKAHLIESIERRVQAMPTDSIASETKTLKVGDMAPDFTLSAAKGTSDKETITLSDFLGEKNVVLVFYPFAFTPV